MESTPSSTNEAIKRKLSISDTADALGVSRPTLYRMIESYENGDYESLRGDAIRLFDIVTRDDVGAEEAQAFLINMRREMRVRSSRPEEAGRPDLDRSLVSVKRMAEGVERRASPVHTLSWSGEDVRVVSFGQSGRSMVVFDGPEGEYSLRLWMDIGGTPYRIAEYPSEKGRRFFTVSDILPRPGYRYEVVCRTDGGEVSSGLQELRFR